MDEEREEDTIPAAEVDAELAGAALDEVIAELTGPVVEDAKPGLEL